MFITSRDFRYRETLCFDGAKKEETQYVLVKKREHMKEIDHFGMSKTNKQ